MNRHKYLYIVLSLFSAFTFNIFYNLKNNSTYIEPNLITQFYNIDIPKDAGLIQTTYLLYQTEIIKQPWIFILTPQTIPNYTKNNINKYLISSNIVYETILNDINRDRTLLHPFLIHEGYTLKQILTHLTKINLVESISEVQALARNHEFIHSLGLEGDSLEGYLFPDTYRLPRGSGAKTAFSIMIRRFHKEWQTLTDHSNIQNFSQRQAVILASIIEREAKNNDERALISAVYHNRLQAGMYLQADPTVSYIVKNPQGKLTKNLLIIDHPYNTYTRRGLPPGPICSPGRASLEAALNPAPVKYLYFVARGDGSHAFSHNYQNQIININKFQKRH